MSVSDVIHAVLSIASDCPISVANILLGTVALHMARDVMATAGPANKTFSTSAVGYVRLVMLASALRILMHATFFATLWR